MKVLSYVTLAALYVALCFGHEPRPIYGLANVPIARRVDCELAARTIIPEVVIEKTHDIAPDRTIVP